MIISFGHKAQTGKTTACEYLAREYGFNNIAFADPLKQAVKIIYGLTDEQLYGKLKDVEDVFWNETPRSILQKMGTDGLRKGHRMDVWVKATERIITSDLKAYWAISDVRFPNEAEMVKSLNGIVVKLTGSFGGREEIGSSMHESELAMDSYNNWDLIIDNNSTLPEFYRKIDEVYQSLEK
jgi:hypothetical protein